MTRPVDLMGRTFANLTVLGRAENTKAGKARWHCKCTCGNETIVISAHLLRGNTKSCGSGCMFSFVAKEPEFRVWHHMKQRCHNSNDTCYKWYGARGIKVCERSRNDYRAFKEDMGTRPFPKAQLDRINNDGDYEPANCRWVTNKQNSRHTRRTKWVTYNGETLALSEWCERLGIRHAVVWHRLDRGWTPEQAFK